MNEIITSVQNPKIKEAAKLKDGKSPLFLVEGFHLTEMALRAGAVELLYAVKPYEANRPVTLVSPEVLKKLSSVMTPEGIVAVCHKAALKPISSPRVLYLDGVADPGNVGTLLRTALSFGFTDVLLGQGSVSLYNSKTIGASQGALFNLNVKENATLSDLEDLKEKQEYALLSTDLNSATSLKELTPRAKEVLILGNEARGVSPAIQKLADLRLRLEMSGIDSLNVAVAGGILMYELRKR